MLPVDLIFSGRLKEVNKHPPFEHQGSFLSSAGSGTSFLQKAGENYLSTEMTIWSRFPTVVTPNTPACKRNRRWITSDSAASFLIR